MANKQTTTSLNPQLSAFVAKQTTTSNPLFTNGLHQKTITNLLIIPMSQSLSLHEAFDEKGQRISPHLPEHVKNYLIDIDGTICDDVPNEEPERMGLVAPYPDALEMLNRWYEDGHIIFFFTSRTEAHRAVTEEWLNRHGFKYHGILFGKPRGGNYHWIDNHIVRATQFKGKFTDLVVQTRNIEVFEE